MYASQNNKPPSLNETSFSCPHCGTFAKQFWSRVYADRMGDSFTPRLITKGTIPDLLDKISNEGKRQKAIPRYKKIAEWQPCIVFRDVHVDCTDMISNLFISQCHDCNDITIWSADRIIYPRQSGAPNPHPDLPKSARRRYEEAGAVLHESPCATVALLRLCVQELCKHLGKPEKSLNENIKIMEQNGLDPQVVMALDIVRVTGNHAVHPGQIDFDDDRTVSTSLFDIVNFVTDSMIAQPKRRKEIYEKLPQSDRENIAKRDRKKSSS